MYDEGQLVIHLVSELWGPVMSLSTRAAGGVSSKSLGRADLPPHHGDWEQLLLLQESAIARALRSALYHLSRG